MIRPTTLVCALLACGSGLYLYQSKHQAQMLDRQIARVVGDTQAARERITTLTAEWQSLNELERLKTLAQQYSNIHPLQPSQTVPLTELAQRLPAPLPASAFAPPEEPATVPPALVASAAPASASGATAAPAPHPAGRPAPVAAMVVAAVAPASPRPIPALTPGAAGPVLLASAPLPARPETIVPRPMSRSLPRPPAENGFPALMVGPAVATPLGPAVLTPRPALVQRVLASAVAPVAALAIAFPSAPPVASALGAAARGSLLPPPVPMH